MTKPRDNVIPMTTHEGVMRATGEIVDVEMPAIRGRRRKGRRKVYALVDLESQVRLELTGQEWSILHKVMAAVNPETNEARIAVGEIADSLGIAQPNVSRVLKHLRDRRIIKTLRQGVHRVNAHLMFRGSNQDWDIATDNEREPVWHRPGSASSPASV